MTVTRTSEPLTISDRQLEAAVEVIETFLREHELKGELDVVVDIEREAPGVQSVTVIEAQLSTPLDVQDAMEAIRLGNQRLRSYKLGYPEVPLLFDVSFQGGRTRA